MLVRSIKFDGLAILKRRDPDQRHVVIMYHVVVILLQHAFDDFPLEEGHARLLG